jgi:hypothetical protein
VAVAAARPVLAERTFADRILAAAPLLSVFIWLCIVYAVEAWAHATPWVFSDELELTQLARSIADTGHPARRGVPYGFHTLWTYLMAPAWLIDDVQRAYDTIKYMGTVVMTATVFPAYGIARMIVGRWPALFAATASVSIPAIAYSSILVEEPLAYFYSTLCLYLVLRALIRPTRLWVAVAIVACAIAPLVRGELGMLLVIFFLAAVFLIWRSTGVTRWRARWSLADWIGFVVVLLTLGIVLSAFIGHHSYEWLIATGFYKSRIFHLGLHAAGALAIGLGVFPVVAGLAVLWRAPGEVTTRPVRAFRCVLLATLIGYGVYTGVKAAWVSTVFGTYTYERNLTYVAPVLFAGMALWLERRRVQPVAVGVAAAFVLYLLLTTPYEMGQDISYNTPGVSILQQANRYFALNETQAKTGLLILQAASVVLLLVVRQKGERLGSDPCWGQTPAVLAIAVAVIAWNFTGELSFASASNRTADLFMTNIRRPTTWVDDHTGGAPTIYIGQQMKDQNSEWLLEFWNRSIRAVWSLDGTAQGPGPVLTPDPSPTDGALNHNPGYPYVVEEKGIDIVGKLVATHVHKAGGHFEAWRLIRVAEPLRLRSSVTGVFTDGWMGAASAYTRYSTEGNHTGRVRVVISRKGWGGPDKPGHVTIAIGKIVIGNDNQPTIGIPTAVRHLVIHSKQEKEVVLQAPGPRFRVEVTVDPTFVPQVLAPNVIDNRHLGALVDYAFLPSRTAAHKKLKR